MCAGKEHLCEVLEHLFAIKNECSCQIFSECGLPDITVKQIGYLKVIDTHGDITFSRLAEITKNSKPTISELVNKFVQMKCVYRERSMDDRRIMYIRLTEKGQMIAQAEKNAVGRVTERMTSSLNENEIVFLIELLNKVR